MNVSNKLYLTAVSIFCFSAFANAEPKEDMSKYFPEVSGFIKKGEPVMYNPDNLYNIIDGAADVYLNYEFKELATLTYEKGEEQSFIIEIYYHKDPNYGFGIYSHERVYGVSNYVNVGVQGYYEEGILNFLKGCYYVKMRGYNLENEETLLLDIAKQIDALLPGSNKFPETMDELPIINRTLNRERFVPKDFLGYSFFKMAYTAGYYTPEFPTGYSFFIMQGESPEDCMNMLLEYRKSLKLPEEEIAEGIYMFEDPYYGTMGIQWEGSRIKGMYGADDEGYIKEQFKFDRKDYILKIDESNVSYKKIVSSSSDENYRLAPESAVDGNLMTRWSSAWSDPQWISVDLGEEYNIDKIKLFWEGAYAKSYTIQVSVDGENWTEVFATEESDGEVDEISIEPVSAKFVRLKGLVRASEYGYSLYEFQVFKVM